jgi:parallel beta-helix repeat protein
VQSLAQVSAIDPSGNYIELQYPYESNPSVSAPIPSDFVEVDSTNYNFARQGLGVIGVWQMDLTKTVKVASNIIRFYDNTSVVGTGWFTHNNNTSVGQYYLIRHYEYDYHGFETTTSDNLTFSNLTVYSTLGMGFHFHENQYCQIINSRLIREPGSLYHLSGSADGINVGNSFGHFKIQNVEIGNTGDDAINIHDTLSQGVKVTGTHSLVAMNVLDWQNPFHVGDTIELRAKDFSLLPWSSTLSAVGAYTNSTGMVPLTFAGTLPGSLDVNTIIFNDHYNSGNFLVSNCDIHDNKVRGMVVHNSNGTIENNVFARNYDPGLFLVCLATKYAEGCNPSNVVIRGNFFDGNDIKRNDFLSMPNECVIAGETTPSGIVSYPICRDIIFENNLVRNCPYAALEISSATNVLADNNTFESPYRANDNSSVLGCVVVQKAGGVVMNNNHLVLDAGLTSYKTNIYQDGTATADVYLDSFIPSTLPSPWTTWDVGGVDLSGSAAYTNGSYTIKGSGADIWSTQDSFQFVYQPWSGDGQIVARVTGVQNTSPWAKAALMFRETLDDDSRNELICLTPSSGVSMQSRTNTAVNTTTVNTISGTAPKWISLMRLSNVVYSYTSSDAVNWTPVGTNTISMATDAYVGLAVTSKSNTVLNASTFDHVTVGGAWLSQDIGSVGVAGGSQINYSNGAVTVQGSGADIWGTSDSFHFLYQSCSGDSTIIARVTSVQNTSPWAKAAVMIRESLSTNSRNTTLFLSPSNAVSLQGRTSTGGLSVTVTNLYGLPAPQWIKLVRSGANINAYQSSNGTNWIWIGTQTNSMATSYYIGLAVSSKTNSVLNTSTFDNVSVQSAWKSGDIGTVAVMGSAAIDDATGAFTVSGAGLDIWSTNDAFQFVDQPLYGNGQIVARVVDVQETSDWAKAGVMIRDTESANAINALLFISPTNGISFQGRTSTGGNTGSFAGAGGTPPYWLKLVRNGSTVTAYSSSSGTSWTQVGSPQTVTMSTSAWIGLAVGSKDNILLNTSMFDNVTVTPAP